MAKLRQLTHSEKLSVEILEALGLEGKHVKRLIIDIQANALVIVYIEMFGDDAMLDLDWSKGLEGAKIEISKRRKKLLLEQD